MLPAMLLISTATHSALPLPRAAQAGPPQMGLLPTLVNAVQLVPLNEPAYMYPVLVDPVAQPSEPEVEDKRPQLILENTAPPVTPLQPDQFWTTHVPLLNRLAY